ncbi:hypothetical protein PENSPDRAFT_645738 [Peniophora sp. CONT]|nr:hypothetical protein PENSPDRAFT_645738 [Peniophora sp. CONT]
MVRLSSGRTSSHSSDSSVKLSSANYWSRRIITPAQRELWQRLIAKRPSFVVLDERFRVPSAPTLHFGMSYTKETIMRCALNHHLLSPDLEVEQENVEDEARRIYLAVMAVKRYFERELGVQLFTAAAFVPGQLGMFALYSNHTRRKLHKRKAERSILNFMRQELGGEKQRAQWYWDRQHGPSYVCEHDEFNL